jgi:hypothetical protein
VLAGMALLPATPVKPLLLLYSVDRFWPERLATGVMLLPRIMFGVLIWYVKGIALYWKSAQNPQGRAPSPLP